MSSTQMEQLKLIKMENEQKRLRELHHQKHYQPYKNLEGQGQSVKLLKPLKKNIFFPNASHVHIHRGADQRQNLSQEPPRPKVEDSRGLHQRELYSKHNNQFPETSVHPRQNTERRPQTNLENQLAKEKPLTRTMQHKKVRKELLFMGGQGNQVMSQNLPEIGGSQSRTIVGPSNDGRKPKGGVIGMAHLKAMNQIYAEKLRDAEQFRNAQAAAQHSQPKGAKKTNRWRQKVSPRHQQLITRRPVGLYASSPRGGKTFDSLPAVGKHARDRDQELAAWARGGGQHAATTGSWDEDDEPRHPYAAQRIPLRGERDDSERQPLRGEAWKVGTPGRGETPGNSEPYLNRADDFGGDAADLRAFQQESDRRSAQEAYRDGKNRASKNRLDLLHEESMPDFLSDDYTGADELNDLALNWPGPVKDARYKLDASHLQVVTDPPAVQAVSQEGAPSPRMETVTNQEARKAAKGIDFALADAAEERRAAHLNKKARQAFLPEVKERSQEHLKLKKYLQGDPAARSKNKYQVREEVDPHQFQRKRNLKSVLPAIRSSRNQIVGEEPNFQVADYQARRKKPTHTTSKKRSNPENLLKSVQHKNTQPEKLPIVSSKLLDAPNSRLNLSSGHLLNGGLRSGLAIHQPHALEHTRNDGSSKALGIKKPSGYSLKVTEFNPPHLHTQDRFEAHNRETCEGCQLADKRKREDDARARKKNSSSPKKARLAPNSAHRSPQRLQNLSDLSPDRRWFRSLDSGNGSPEGSRHHEEGREASGAKRGAGRSSKQVRSISHSPQGRSNLHLNNHHTQHSPEERPRIIGGGGRLSPSRYQLNHQLRDKELQTLSPKGRNHNLQLASAKERVPAKRINNFTPRHGQQNALGGAGGEGKEDNGMSGSPAVRLTGQDGNTDDAHLASGMPRHSKSPSRGGPPRVHGKYESAIGREKIWREAAPGHRRIVSKDRFGRLAHDNKEVAGSPDSDRLRQPSGRRTKDAAPKHQQKKPVTQQPKEKARLSKAIDPSTASLRKPKPGTVHRQRNKTMPNAPEPDCKQELPALYQLDGDEAEPIRLKTQNLHRGRNLFESSNQHTLDGEAKGAADAEQNSSRTKERQDIAEDIIESKQRPSSKAKSENNEISENQNLDEDLPSEIVNLNLVDQIDEAQAKRRNDVSPFSLPPEYTAPLERSGGDSGSQKPAAVAAEEVPGLTTPEGRPSQLGSVERDSALSKLNRVRFKDEVVDEASPDAEDKSQNKSSNGSIKSKSSLVADVQGDVAILDNTMNSRGSGSGGSANLTQPALQQDATSQPAAKTPSSNVSGTMQSDLHKTLEKQSTMQSRRTSDVMSQLNRANSIRAPAHISSKSVTPTLEKTASEASPSKLHDTLGHGSITEAEVSIISEQSTAKELGANAQQDPNTQQHTAKEPSAQAKDQPALAASKKSSQTDIQAKNEAEQNDPSNKGFGEYQQDQQDEPIHIQNQSEHPQQIIKQPSDIYKSEQKELMKEPSKRQSSQAQANEGNKVISEAKRPQSKRQISKQISSKKQSQSKSKQEELRLTASIKESSQLGDAGAGQQRSRNDSIPKLARSKHSLASVNDQLNRTGANGRFMMDEAPESRNHQLAQTQSLSRLPQQIEADNGVDTSGSRRQETEKGILRNKEEQLRTISSKEPLGRHGLPEEEALKRRRQRQEVQKAKQSQKEEKIGPDDWGYASAFQNVDSRASAMQKTQDSALKDKMAKRTGDQTLSEGKSKSPKSRRSIGEEYDRQRREEQRSQRRSPRRSSRGKNSAHDRQQQSPSRKSGADDARSLSRKQSSASAYPKWVDGKQHKSGTMAVESEASHHRAERSSPRRKQSSTDEPDAKKTQNKTERRRSPVAEQRERPAYRGPKSERSRSPSPQVKARQAVHQATSTGAPQQEEELPELCSSHQHSMSAMAMEASEAGEAPAHTPRAPPRKQKPKLKPQKLLVDTAQSPGALQESDSSIESVDLQQVQKDVKEAATEPIAVDVQHAEAQTMTSVAKPRGREIHTQTEPLSTHARTPEQKHEDEPAVTTPESTEKHLTRKASTVQDVQEEEDEEEDEVEDEPEDEEEEQPPSTKSVPAEQKLEEPEKPQDDVVEGTVDPLDATTAAPARDWYRSGIYDLALDVVHLPAAGQLAAARALEQHFCNPKGLDIFTEAEAGYNASLLRQKGAAGSADVQAATDATHDLELLQALYRKATRTVELLSEHVLLTKDCGCTMDGHESHDEGQKGHSGHASPDAQPAGGALAAVGQGSAQGVAQKGSATEVMTKVVEAEQQDAGQAGQEPASRALRHEDYREHNVNVGTVIKLLLRCKKLYQAMAEVKKVLQLIIKQEELFDTESGLVYACLRKYRPAVSDPPLEQEDEAVFEKAFRVLVQVSRRIAHFLDDHLIYKQFIYKGQEHRIALLKHAWKLHRFFKRKKGDDSHASLVDDIQKNLTASLDGLEDTSAQSSSAAIAEGGQERISLAASSTGAPRRAPTGTTPGQEDEVEHGSSERAIGTKQKKQDQQPREKVEETPQPEGKTNTKEGGPNSRPTPQGAEANEVGPVSLKKPKVQNQKSKPVGESQAKPKAQPTPAAPVALGMAKVSEAGSAEQSQGDKPKGARGQAAATASKKGITNLPFVSEKSLPKGQSSTNNSNQRGQIEQPSDAQKKKVQQKQRREQTGSDQLDDLRQRQTKTQPSVVSQSQQSLAKFSEPSEKSRNARHGMHRGKRDEDQSMKSVGGGAQSKPVRATTPELGKAPPQKATRKPAQVASLGVQTSPPAQQERKSPAASPEWSKPKAEGRIQQRESGGGSRVKKQTRDTASSPLAIQPAPKNASLGTETNQKKSRPRHLDQEKSEIVEEQESEGKEFLRGEQQSRADNATPSVEELTTPLAAPLISHTQPLGAARQHKPTEASKQQPRATPTQASQEIANLARSNELLASRVSQLASKLESSVDLDAMIKENYHLLRQGARVDSKLNQAGDPKRLTNGQKAPSDAGVPRKEPRKAKGAQRYGEEAKASRAPAGLAPRAEQHILLEERSRTPALPQPIRGQDQQFWSHGHAERAQSKQEMNQVDYAYQQHAESLKSQTTVGATAQARIAQDGSVSSVTELASFGKVIQAGRRPVYDNEYGETKGPTPVAGQHHQSWALTAEGRPSTALRRPGLLPQGQAHNSGALVNQRASAPNAQVPIPSSPGLR